MKKIVGAKQSLVAAVRSGKMPPSKAIEQYLTEQKLPCDIYDVAFERYGICGCCLTRAEIDKTCRKQDFAGLLDWIDAHAQKSSADGQSGQQSECRQEG
jgi:hypothetical protein